MCPHKSSYHLKYNIRWYVRLVQRIRVVTSGWKQWFTFESTSIPVSCRRLKIGYPGQIFKPNSVSGQNNCSIKLEAYRQTYWLCEPVLTIMVEILTHNTRLTIDGSLSLLLTHLLNGKFRLTFSSQHQRIFDVRSTGLMYTYQIFTLCSRLYVYTVLLGNEYPCDSMSNNTSIVKNIN